jgi:hypothetical protein
MGYRIVAKNAQLFAFLAAIIAHLPRSTPFAMTCCAATFVADTANFFLIVRLRR